MKCKKNIALLSSIVIYGIIHCALTAQDVVLEKLLPLEAKQTFGASVKEFSDGKLAVAATSVSASGVVQPVVFYCSATGEILSYTDIQEPRSTTARRLVINSRNEAVFLASRQTDSGQVPIIYVFDANGNFLKRKELKFNAVSVDFHHIALDKDGKYALAGNVVQTSSDKNDMFAVVLDSNFSVEWQKVIGGTDAEDGKQLLPLPDGNYALLGDTRSYAATKDSAGTTFSTMVAKLDSKGNLIWRKVIGNDIDVFGSQAILCNSNNELIVVGESRLGGLPLFDIPVTKISQNGDILLQKMIPAPGADAGFSIVEETPNRYWIAGYSSSNPFDNSQNILVSVIDSSFREITRSYYGTPWYEDVTEMIQLRNGNFALAGTESPNRDQKAVLLVLKPNQVTTVLDEEPKQQTGILDKITMKQYGEELEITSDFVVGNTEIELRIYDAIGRELHTESFMAGEKHVVNLVNYPSNIYVLCQAKIPQTDTIFRAIFVK